MSIPQVLAMRVAKLSKPVKPTVIRIPPFSPGPQDTKFIFDIFLQSIIACLQDGSFLPVTMPGGSHFENSLKIPRVLVKKVLVLGSGGLSIGQALSDKTGNLAEIDYSTAEALAFRTKLEEGYDIRLSGQDSGQGEFSQRHALLTDQVVEGRTIVPLNQLSAKNSQPGNLEIVNSPLSKYAVLGFELGLSYLTSRLCLTFWEAQFGDFANTAQVAVESSIDQ
ncbi:Transketolase, pyrimidine binding domain-domain-containing protein [Phakopsora pachyrhizi]|uniref:Transketolase, pyrimidine binding domain-domain-containing protein n=1 Tax=Phakopsora pachyrhizi TaxID=170000 RepID=A0AAV0AU86_PHAPC|nr:Transketolase, pyrimidine binding domain-domain-containing protein [Phakopsora pachyrhizi]